MASVIRSCSRNMATSADVIKHVTVIGGGLMGSGIAQVSQQKKMFPSQIMASLANHLISCAFVIVKNGIK